ncbi:hypothetical protein GCM10009558_055060 [Virgisporangium aurantiacum]
MTQGMTARMRELLRKPRRALLTAGTVTAVVTMAVLPFALRAAASAAPELTAANSITTRNQDASVSASCDRGYTAVGVSAELSGFESVRITKMWPEGRTATARGTASAPVTSSWTLRVQAVCVKDSAQIVAQTSVARTGSTVAAAVCSPGRQLIGFGWAAGGDGRLNAIEVLRGGSPGAWPTGTGGYPPGTGGWPTSTGGYPTSTGGYPTGGYPTGTGSYPTGDYPTATGSYPTGTGSYPTGGYPTGTGSYPTGGYPTGTGSYPTGGYPTGGYPTGGYPTGTGGYPTGGYPTGGYPTGTGGYPTGGYPTGGYPTGGYPTGTGGYPTGGYPTGGGGTGPINGIVAFTPLPQDVAVIALCTRSDFGTTAINRSADQDPDGTVRVSTRCDEDSEVSSLGTVIISNQGRLRALTVTGKGHSAQLVISHPDPRVTGPGTLTALCAY